MMKSKHYGRVEEFCSLANHTVNQTPTLPNVETRRLRAALILEECLETIEALGFTVQYMPGFSVNNHLSIKDNLQFVVNDCVSLSGIADGCADIMVVTTGTLVACGIADEPLLELVDNNNLQKFGPGHSYKNGKLIKPPGHTKPDIDKLLSDLSKSSEVQNAS